MEHISFLLEMIKAISLKDISDQLIKNNNISLKNINHLILSTLKKTKALFKKQYKTQAI